MPEENIKSMHPADRIKKLKELEKQKKKEIEEAQKQIRDSETELNEEKKVNEKVPESALSMLDVPEQELSEEERQIVEQVKGKSSKSKIEEKAESEAEEEKKKLKIQSRSAQQESLEEIARKVGVSPEVMQSEYTLHLSKEPMHNLHQEITQINKEVEDKGYINAEEQRRIQYLSSAVERKIEDANMGRYSFTEEVEMAAVLSQQIGARLLDNYHSKKRSDSSGEMYKNQ